MYRWVHYWFEIPALIENYLCLSFVEKSLYHGEIGADESGVLTAMEIFDKKGVFRCEWTAGGKMKV